MVTIYYKRVRAGVMSIDEVPRLWRAKVQAMLDADAAEEDN